MVTEYEFKLAYTKLCANYGKNTNSDAIQIKGDLFFEKYAKVPAKVFNDTIDLVMERHGATYGYFPAIKEISTCMSEVISRGSDKDGGFAECSICDRYGGVSLLIAYKDLEGGGKKVDERHVWTLPLSIELRKSGKRFYDYHACCRCEKGQDLYNRREGNTFQLTVEEYNKLLEGVHEVVKGKENKQLLLQEEAIPF